MLDQHCMLAFNFSTKFTQETTNIRHMICAHPHVLASTRLAGLRPNHMDGACGSSARLNEVSPVYLPWSQWSPRCRYISGWKGSQAHHKTTISIVSAGVSRIRQAVHFTISISHLRQGTIDNSYHAAPDDSPASALTELSFSPCGSSPNTCGMRVQGSFPVPEFIERLVECGMRSRAVDRFL